MIDDSPTETIPARLPKFSLASLLILMTVVCLALSLAFVYGRLQEVESRLSMIDGRQVLQMPIPAQEVVRQLENHLNFSGVQINVADVRYSPSEDAYKVDLSWSDPAAKLIWSTDVKLKSDGFGRYFGATHSSEFLKVAGSKNDSYMVFVETPSPLKSK